MDVDTDILLAIPPRQHIGTYKQYKVSSKQSKRSEKKIFNVYNFAMES